MGDAGMDHLLPRVREMVGRSKEERILFVQEDRWIEYPAATNAIEALSDLLAGPRDQIRPLGLFLAARGNNGKSALLRRFEALNSATSADNGEVRIPVVLMSMPDEPTEAKFWSYLLTVLKIPHRITDPPKVHKALAMRMLETVKCRMLIIDEIHNLLEGSAKESSHALVILKMLSNELSLRIVTSGTGKAIAALLTDEEVSTRFGLETLPPWRPNMAQRNFLAGMETLLPLAERSNLDSREMVMALDEKSKPTIGSKVLALQAATILAVRSGRERLDPELMAKVDASKLGTWSRSTKLDI